MVDCSVPYTVFYVGFYCARLHGSCTVPYCMVAALWEVTWQHIINHAKWQLHCATVHSEKATQLHSNKLHGDSHCTNWIASSTVPGNKATCAVPGAVTGCRAGKQPQATLQQAGLWVATTQWCMTSCSVPICRMDYSVTNCKVTCTVPNHVYSTLLINLLYKSGAYLKFLWYSIGGLFLMSCWDCSTSVVMLAELFPQHTWN